jgi:hypothetical protein
MNCVLCDKKSVKRGYCNSHYTILLRNGNITRKFKKNESLSELQKEFITGCLLGDAWISNIKYGRKNPSFGIDRKQDDLDYLQWQYKFVENLCSRQIKIKNRLNKSTNKTQKHCLFETRYLSSLLELRKLWYPNEKKIVPNNLKLTKLVMQIWYCDDGNLEIISPTSFRIKLSTHGFSKNECKFLISLLEQRYNCKGFSLVKDHKNKKQYCIRINHKSSIIVLNDLKENFPPGMKRKLDLEKIIL